MSTPDEDAPKVRAAEAKVALARARLTATLGELQSRLKPGALAHEAGEKIKTAGQNIAEAGVETARNRPAVAAAIAAGVLGLLARHRIGHGLSRLFGRDATGDDKTRSKVDSSRDSARHSGRRKQP